MPIINYNGEPDRKQCSPKKSKTMPADRKCTCGAVLSIYNRGSECGACSLARARRM